MRTDAITKCRVIQKIDKTLNNITHTAKQKRTNRHNLREVNRGVIHHLHISHNTPCFPPPPPRPPREIEDNACAQFKGGGGGGGETEVYFLMRDVQWRID